LRVRTAAGVVIAVLGIVAFLLAGVNFNTLFFENRFARVEDVPAYARIVVLPFLISVLLLFDASFILGLKRYFSLAAHLVGNVVWLWASYTLYTNLLVPVSELQAYRLAFFGFLLAIVIFVIGIVVNDVSPGKRQQYPAR
jgi:hypothetical protein